MTAVNALLAFTAWTLLLVLGVVLYRTTLVFFRRTPANSWTRGAASASPAIVTRAEHAHMNCVENLPVFAAIVLAAVALGKAELIAGAATWVVVARIVQSTIHLSGTSHWQVVLRAVFYTAQILLFFWMIWSLAA